MTNFLNPPAMPPQLGLYSQVALAPQAGLVFVAGQISIDDQEGVIGIDDVGLQFKTVMEYIGAALRAVDLDYDDIVQMTTYLTDRGDIQPFYERREKLFPTIFLSGEYPPNTLILTSGLVLSDALIEIQAIASTRGQPDPV